jgi:hypothetical protein
MKNTKIEVLRRTFEAAKHPPGSKDRAASWIDPERNADGRTIRQQAALERRARFAYDHDCD